METKKKILHTTLSYWPNKEFEILGIVVISNIDQNINGTTNVTISPFSEIITRETIVGAPMYVKEKKSIVDKVFFRLFNNESNLWNETDAIIDLKPFNPIGESQCGDSIQHGTKYIGTAIKFKK